MASDDTMTVHSSMQEDDDDEMEDHHHHHRYNMSRLSTCTSNSKGSFSDDVNDDMIFNMSRLSVEDDGSDVDADGELSDGKEVSVGLDDDSDRESPTGWLSLPASPHGRVLLGSDRWKEYGSESESCRVRRSRRRLRERWLERAREMKKWKSGIDQDENQSGESECVVIARRKGGGGEGGGRSLCMDMEEIKACRDLGFDLQREWTLEIPPPNRISGSTIDTDSGGNSPISSWRICSPGEWL